MVDRARRKEFGGGGWRNCNCFEGIYAIFLQGLPILVASQNVSYGIRAASKSGQKFPAFRRLEYALHRRFFYTYRSSLDIYAIIAYNQLKNFIRCLKFGVFSY